MPEAPAVDSRSLLSAWITAFNLKDLDRICGLYSLEAILLGTLSSSVIATPQGIRDYFLAAFAPELQASIELRGVQFQRLDSVSIASGEYLLTVIRTGSCRVLPARFTFVLAQTGDSCRIIHHHSSVMPSQQSAEGESRSKAT